VFPIECLLNQNARDQGAARSPAVERQPVDLLLGAQIGLPQIPCPETACLGFRRNRAPGQSLRQALEAEQPAACCRRLALITARRIRTYLDQGCQVIAILGGNEQSPGCAVHTADGTGTRLTDRTGMFMRALAHERAKLGCRIPFHGVRDADPDLLEQDLRWLRQRLIDLRQAGQHCPGGA
jgi:predicted secreted protein